jgi:hypothetical protein
MKFPQQCLGSHLRLRFRDNHPHAFRGAAFSPDDKTVRIENRRRRACLEGQIKNFVAELIIDSGEADPGWIARRSKATAPSRSGRTKSNPGEPEPLVPERRELSQTTVGGRGGAMNCAAHFAFRIDEIRSEWSTAFPSSAKLSISAGGSASPVHMAVPRWGAQTSRLSTI